MTWNLPKEQQKPKVKSDPWTDRGTDPKKAAAPPNLETLLINVWLKAKRRCSGWRSPEVRPRAWLKWVIGVVVAIWFVLGVHHVTTNQLAYVLRLGVYQGQLTNGWQWRAWGLYQVKILPQPLTLTVAPEVISQDLNLAKVSMTLNYRVVDPKAYLFSMNTPVLVLKALSDSALQQVVGQVNVDALLSEKNPPALLAALKPLLQSLCTQANLGVQIETLRIDDVAIPDTLQELFTKMDALYETQATTRQKNLEYQQSVLPPADLKAQLTLTAAHKAAEQAILTAQTAVADYLSILPSYEKNPKLIKYQLYTHNMTTILSESTAVVVDAKVASPMIVLNDSVLKNMPVTDNSTTVASSVSEADTNDSYGDIKGGYGS